MPQFLVVLHDGTDTEAPARRQATRPAHLAGLTANVAAGKLVFGGPLLDDAQKPIGSFLLVDCADRAELDAIIANDPVHEGQRLAEGRSEFDTAGCAGRQDYTVVPLNRRPTSPLRPPGIPLPPRPDPPHLVAEREPCDHSRHQDNRDQDQRDPQRERRDRQRRGNRRDDQGPGEYPRSHWRTTRRPKTAIRQQVQFRRHAIAHGRRQLARSRGWFKVAREQKETAS